MSLASSLARIKSNIAGALGYTPLNKAGDTMTGILDLASQSEGQIRIKKQLSNGTKWNYIEFYSDPNNPTTRHSYIGTDSVGNTSINGVIGATPSGLAYLPNGQLQFPNAQNASPDANTLDDYEEGSWNPSTNIGSIYFNNGAYYTKVGRLVTVYCYIGVNNTTGATANGYNITGLPFTAITYSPVVHYYGVNPFSGNCYVESGSTYMIINDPIPAGQYGQMFMATYFTN